MPLLFQMVSRSERPDLEKKPLDATLSLENQRKVAKEGFDASCNSMRLLGYDVDKLIASGKLSDFKKAKPAKSMPPQNEKKAGDEFEKAIRAFQYLLKYLPEITPRQKVRAGENQPPLSPEEKRRITLNYLTTGLDMKPDWSYLFNAMELHNSYVLESTPKKK